MNGCRLSVILQRDLRFGKGGTHKNNKTLNELEVNLKSSEVKNGQN